jgi:hypothetical protein
LRPAGRRGSGEPSTDDLFRRLVSIPASDDESSSGVSALGQRRVARERPGGGVGDGSVGEYGEGAEADGAAQIGDEKDGGDDCPTASSARCGTRWAGSDGVEQGGQSPLAAWRTLRGSPRPSATAGQQARRRCRRCALRERWRQGNRRPPRWPVARSIGRWRQARRRGGPRRRPPCRGRA